MARRVPIKDVMAAALPAEFRHAAAANQLTLPLLAHLEDLARHYIARQYVGTQDLEGLEIGTHEWLITKDQSTVDTFQPGDGCAACIAGNDQAKAFLRDNPDQYVILGNLNYTEVWAS